MKKLFYILTCLTLLFSAASVVYAEAQPSGLTSQQSSATYGGGTPTTAGNLTYTPLEPIPGLTTGTNLTDPNSLPVIINAIFKIFITVAALFAVLMLTVGGIQYMVSGSAATKAAGLKRTQAALWGIVLIAAIWLILQTINPNLLNFTLNPCQGISGGCTVTGTAVTQDATANTNNNLGSAATADDMVKQVDSIDKPSASQCEQARLGLGITTPANATSFSQTVSALGRGYTQLSFVISAAYNATDKSSITQSVINGYSAGSDTYNKLMAADTALVGRCTDQGL